MAAAEEETEGRNEEDDLDEDDEDVSLPDLLSRVVDERTLPDYITKAMMVYVPQVGYFPANQPWLSQSTEKGDSRATQDVKQAFDHVLV